mmetsp:Transcript_12243/g.34974  ORF Transcript_12243/g.34974 Transcript_12243/m.34974 type:complete len:261 (+) Transcript_12243:382-1164(+)
MERRQRPAAAAEDREATHVRRRRGDEAKSAGEPLEGGVRCGDVLPSHRALAHCSHASPIREAYACRHRRQRDVDRSGHRPQQVRHAAAGQARVSNRRAAVLPVLLLRVVRPLHVLQEEAQRPQGQVVRLRHRPRLHDGRGDLDLDGDDAGDGRRGRQRHEQRVDFANGAAGEAFANGEDGPIAPRHARAHDPGQGHRGGHEVGVLHPGPAVPLDVHLRHRLHAADGRDEGGQGVLRQGWRLHVYAPRLRHADGRHHLAAV